MKRILQAVLTIFMLLLAAQAGFSASPAIGSSAPVFSLPESGSGGTISLSSELSRNKLTVVMFIATQCPYSNGYNERMEELEKTYHPRGVRILAVNSNVSEPAPEVVAHARKHGFTFPVLKDERSKVADLYDAQKTPEIFVIDAAGVVRYHGRIDETHTDPGNVKHPDLKNALDALLAGKPVPVAETKAFGCSIKRG